MKKARWKPFFEHVSLWSSEYLIVFDTPYAGSSGIMASKGEVELSIAQAKAKVLFRWE